MASERYPESKLQREVTAFLAAQGFEEVFDDVMALGSRFDSVGVLDEQLILIEYKVAIGKNMVPALESKLAGCLRPLYSNGNDPLSVAANRNWSKNKSPLVMFVANRITSDAEARLRALLARRSVAWLFDYKLACWNGSGLDVVAEGRCPQAVSAGDFEALDLPELKIKVERAPNLSVQECLDLTEGLRRELLEVFVEEARKCGFVAVGKRSCISAQRKTVKGHQTVLSAFLRTEGEADGLNLGVEETIFVSAPPKLPGVAGPVEGFLNINRFVTTPDEIRALMNLVHARVRDTNDVSSLSL
jgi:hypothetical protein